PPPPLQPHIEILVLHQALPDGLEAPAIDPALESPMDRGARPKLPRDGLPLAARAEHVQHAIEHAPRREPASSPGRQELFDREEHRHPIPHLVWHATNPRPARPLPLTFHPHLHPHILPPAYAASRP